MDFLDVALLILHHFVTFHDVRALQTDFFARCHTEEFLHRRFHEIFSFDIQISSKRHFALAHGWYFRIVFDGHFFDLSFRIVGKHYLHRIYDYHEPRCFGLQVFTDAILQLRDVYQVVRFRYAYKLTEETKGLGGVASSTDAADGGHTGIVPAGHQTCFYHFAKLSLAGDHGGHIQAGKFDLSRFLFAFECLEAPVVQRSSFFEFQRADGMGDAFQRIGQRMGEIIERVNAPSIAGSMVRSVEDAVNDRVSHDHIRRRHIDFRAKHLLAVGILAFLHFFEELQVFFDTSISIRTFLARMTQIAAGIVDFFTGLVIYISEALADEYASKFI